MCPVTRWDFDMVNVSVLTDLCGKKELKDWGSVTSPIGNPISRQSGVLLFRNPDGSSEMGLWQCTPGEWRCDIERDEFCHFLAGRARYLSDSGEVIDIRPGTAAAFPRGWVGVCEVLETVRKVYMIG